MSAKWQQHGETHGTGQEENGKKYKREQTKKDIAWKAGRHKH
jgi:hypothetical protein